MTITQLEYIIAVDTHRNFNVAAKNCFVSQPTLSMQIQKLEEELGIKLFERAKQPIVPTPMGVVLLEQARITLGEFHKIKELVEEQEQALQGELRVGIIPTVSPYILPRILSPFKQYYPQVKLVIWEQTTDAILQQVKTGQLDCGIVSAPIDDAQLVLQELFSERFIAYIGDPGKREQDERIDPKDINVEDLWLLDEGHCMRDQVLNFCQLRDRHRQPSHYEYKTGSIETLKKMVEENDGITILPELAILDLTPAQQDRVRPFTAPEPRRSICLVTQRSFLKRMLIGALKEQVLAAVEGRLPADAE
ncbi:transcriptional regulator, LysR family [Filimonas lacunae]|uniref:Transcriptional regulator, LysR family n=1 Tax=Filimonas lacunae TaxID=477680 RepID=A0A173MBE4_9BACT|nr:hydrogen peroxide-inducible genes activator [Filimonas lacunae]BAV04893.1 hydrogen peroxide-inducible genes activator [Filimonas lacunae]SIT33840.1 transcriptional regulator, LysR family [Filimonas lacunae]